MGQARLPVFRKELRFFGDRVNVVGQGQCHHIGFEAVDDRPGLFA
jgi:hypothetical protein